MSRAKPEKRALPKRFYERATLDSTEGGYAILLDGKNIKTPGKKMLQVSLQQIAAAIAAEWDAQHEVIDTDTMPLTRLASITLDRAEQDRAEWLKDIRRYGETDLLCYRVPQADDAVLRSQQDAMFDPILAWAKEALGVSFAVTEGLMPVVQMEGDRAKIAAAFAAAKNDELAALAMLVPLLGSVLLPLALWRGKITVVEALKAARLDEDRQAEHWGADPESTKAWESKARDIKAAVFFLTGKCLENRH